MDDRREIRVPSSRGKLRRIAAAVTLLAALAPCLGASQAQVTYYVANSGNDANRGTSPNAPWRTIAKVNLFLKANGTASLAGVSVLFQRGGLWHEGLECINDQKAQADWTISDHPAYCSGSSASAFLIGAYGAGASPIIDGADTLDLHWTRVSGATWRAQFSGSAMPAKLYVDGPKEETDQLLPVPNEAGNWDPARVYQPYDAVDLNGRFYIRGPLPPAAGQNPEKIHDAWLQETHRPRPFNPDGGLQTASGPENVSAIPGSWYGTANWIYVHLSDGSDPNGHSFEGTARPYGILLAGANHVRVENLTVEHTLQSGIAEIAFPADHASYFTGEYNEFLHNHVFNYGSIVADHLPLGGHDNALQAGILIRADAQYDPHLLRGELVSDNYVGVMDSYLGVGDGHTSTNQAGILLSGIDGGGAANHPVITGNFIRTRNGAGLHYDTTGLYASSGKVILNNGGMVSHNQLTDNQGNIYFTATAGGLDTGNLIEFSYGEGIQTGGESTSTADQPQVHSFNVIAHVGKGASGAIFNGFDCNTQGRSFSDGYWLNNTVYDVNSAAFTLEAIGSAGCIAAHVHNNIFDQNALEWPAYQQVNPSYLFYFDRGFGDRDADFSHNWWINGRNSSPWYSKTLKFHTCVAFAAAWPDRGARCDGDPQFVDPGKGDMRLKPVSSAAADSSDSNWGAFPPNITGPFRLSPPPAHPAAINPHQASRQAPGASVRKSSRKDS